MSFSTLTTHRDLPMIASSNSSGKGPLSRTPRPNQSILAKVATSSCTDKLCYAPLTPLFLLLSTARLPPGSWALASGRVRTRLALLSLRVISLRLFCRQYPVCLISCVLLCFSLNVCTRLLPPSISFAKRRTQLAISHLHHLSPLCGPRCLGSLVKRGAEGHI